MSKANERLSNTAVIAAALHQHRSALQSFIRARVKPDEVEDIVQTAAVRAIERAATLEDSSRVLPWLYRLHRNIITDVTRQRASQRRLVDATAPVPEQAVAEQRSICRCSLSQVSTMNPSHASILALVDMGESSLKEAAEVLGVSVNNATVRLHRARKALKRRMYEHCGVTSLRDCADCRCVHEGCCAA